MSLMKLFTVEAPGNLVIQVIRLAQMQVCQFSLGICAIWQQCELAIAISAVTGNRSSDDS